MKALRAPIGAESVSLQVVARQKSRVHRPAPVLRRPSPRTLRTDHGAGRMSRVDERCRGGERPVAENDIHPWAPDHDRHSGWSVCDWQPFFASTDNDWSSGDRYSLDGLGARDVWTSKLPCHGRTYGRRACDDRSVSAHSTSNLHGGLPLLFLGHCYPLVLAERHVRCAVVSWRAHSNFLRGANAQTIVPGVSPILQGHEADDSVCVLTCMRSLRPWGLGKPDTFGEFQIPQFQRHPSGRPCRTPK
jgi:hypothetical protein